MTIGLRVSTLDRTQPIPRQLYDILRSRIVDNSLRPGERISEAALSQEFDISRTPLRAALQRLADEGLVLVRPQVGTLVARLDVDKLHEAVFIRKALECAVVENLATAKHNLASLEQVLSLQATAAARDDYATFFHYDEAFHAQLAELANVSMAWRMVQSVKGHVDRQRYTLMSGIPMRSQRAFEEHKNIVEAIQKGDVRGASKAMGNHVTSVLELDEGPARADHSIGQGRTS